MKIIDERGRLFGKLNVIDFLVISFFIFIIPIFYFGYKIFTRKPPTMPVELTQIELNCKFVKVEPETLKIISAGDKEIDDKGKVIGEIIWLGEVKPYQYEFNIGGNEKITKADTNLKEILAKLKLEVEVKGDNMYYKNDSVAINSIFNFKTNKYIMQSKPIVLATYKEERRDIELNCKFVKVEPETLKIISAGDKEIDDKGKVIGEIIWLGEVKPYQYEFNIGGNEKITKADTNLKEILAKLKINVEIKDNNSVYYKNEQVLANFPIKFKTEKYAVQVIPNIVRIEEKWVQIKVRFIGLIPEIIKVLSEGDVEKNPDGRVEATLEKITKKHSSEVLVMKNLDWITVNHPFLNDIEATFNILCREKDGLLYYKNYPVKIGNNITFNADLYSISGAIINLTIN